MNKRPGTVRVTTEAGFCTFCGRVRTLRREEHQLGAMVRTVMTCEHCHRTLSSTMGIAAEAETAEKTDSAAPAKTTAAEAATPAVVKPAARTRKPAASSRASTPTSKTRRK